jgi:hypothetical protein
MEDLIERGLDAVHTGKNTMKSASGHSNDLTAGAMSVPSHGLDRRPNHFPKYKGIALLTMAVVFGSSMLLPDNLARLALDLVSWCVVGALASIALVAVVKVIEGLLDL